MAADCAPHDYRYAPDARVMGGISSIQALDKRTRSFKRYSVIVGAVLADMGGTENVSEIQRQLIAKFATLALQLEAMEAAAIEGNEIDLDLFGRCAGHLRRIAEALGINRIPRDVTPSVAEYVADAAAGADEAATAA